MKEFKLPKPEIDLLFKMVLKQDGDILVKNNGKGDVLFSPIVGGSFKGKRLKGRIMPIGTQYCLLTGIDRNDLEGTILLRTDDEKDIIMQYKGTGIFGSELEAKMKEGKYVDPSAYYYKYHIAFETGSATYDWLNGKCCFAVIGVEDWKNVWYDVYMIK